MQTRVVLCDDREDLRVLVRLVFTEAGLDVVGETGDGQAAVELVDCMGPDVIVVDLGLPGTDGGALVGALRERFPALGIVVYSGSVSAAVGAAMLERGADAFVEKGTEFDELIETVRAVHTSRS